MSLPPVVPGPWPGLVRQDEVRAERAAAALLRRHPALVPEGWVRELMPRALADGPALVLDDLDAIARADRFYDVSYLEDRARLRAGDGDVVASCTPADAAFERHCEERLGLGVVRWLRPRARHRSLRVAVACWTDRAVRRELVAALRAGELVQVHPHMGSFDVWATAWLLRRRARRPLTVLAPPPGLSALANDKLWFAGVVRRLFGDGLLPPTARAWNRATLALLVRSFARGSESIIVKLPDSAGGSGNLRLDAALFRGLSAGEIRRALDAPLGELGWSGAGPLLVGRWESHVRSTPSVQLWIPPAGVGPPVAEGVFEQMTSGREGSWTGSVPSALPSELEAAIARHGLVVARVFQLLGYVGRASFDLIVTEPPGARPTLRFVECNGRWGGTSIPMTLLNRLFGDWRRRPFAVGSCAAAGLERLSFARIAAALGPDLFDARTGAGRLIPYGPGGPRAASSIDVVALGSTAEEAAEALRELPRRLAPLAAQAARGGSASTRTSSPTSSTPPSGTSLQASSEIGSEATTTAR